jgi:hypothetical protein
MASSAAVVVRTILDSLLSIHGKLNYDSRETKEMALSGKSPALRPYLPDPIYFSASRHLHYIPALVHRIAKRMSLLGAMLGERLQGTIKCGGSSPKLM